MSSLDSRRTISVGAGDIDAEGALNGLMQQAGQRPVVLINPRMGNTPLLRTFEAAYSMRVLSLAYVSDQYSKQVDRVSACVLRCYPHEWGVLVDAAERGATQRTWKYAGRFSSSPQPEALEAMLQTTLTEMRNEKIRAAQRGQAADGA